MTHLAGEQIYFDSSDDLMIEVRDQGQTRSLYFGGKYLQSRMSFVSPHSLLLSYSRVMVFSLLLCPEPTRILIIGLGAGSLVRFFHHHFPSATIDAVDNSPRVIEIARGWFQLPENQRVAVHCADGAEFLARQGSCPYDLIFLDAFDQRGMAPTIYNEYFIALAARTLSPSGAVCANLWSGNDTFFQEIIRTFTRNFGTCLRLSVPRKGNIVLVAMNDEMDWTKLGHTSKTLNKLSVRYQVNFHQMLRLVKQHNLSLSQRFFRLFSFIKPRPRP